MRQDDCPHCGQALRASLLTWIVMVLSIVLFVALLYSGALFCHRFGVAKEARKLVMLAVAIPPMMLLHCVEWRTGRYSRRN